jgi:Protein of unknown function (DUF3300)
MCSLHIPFLILAVLVTPSAGFSQDSGLVDSRVGPDLSTSTTQPGPSVGVPRPEVGPRAGYSGVVMPGQMVPQNVPVRPRPGGQGTALVEGHRVLVDPNSTASSQSPSWPTPPAPAPQAESPASRKAERATAPQTEPASQLWPARFAQMLAPIALYPDDVLADVLAAATYPLDVVEAARWLQDPQNAALKDGQLFAALQQKSWDPSVKALAPFPRILRMLDANIEWTEQLGEAYLAGPAAVMDAVQRLRRRAQSAGRLVTTPQEIARMKQESVRIEETITIEAPRPEVVYVPICDPSFTYGSWPDLDYPPFFPAFAGATIGGCDWIAGPIIAPFALNFRTRRIEIDRKRLARLDRDRERDRDHALGEEWRHDPGHRGNVPYRDAPVSALFGSQTPAANFNPAFRGRLTAPSPVVAPLAASLLQKWRPAMEVQPSLDGGRAWPEAIRAPIEGRRSSTPKLQAAFGAVRPALAGVDPTESRAPVGPSLHRDAEGRMLIERELMGRIPSAALALPSGGLRASRSFWGMGSTLSLGDRRSFLPLVGVGAQPFGAGGSSGIGVQPWGPRMPSGGIGAGGRGGG